MILEPTMITTVERSQQLDRFLIKNDQVQYSNYFIKHLHKIGRRYCISNKGKITIAKQMQKPCIVSSP